MWRSDDIFVIKNANFVLKNINELLKEINHELFKIEVELFLVQTHSNQDDKLLLKYLHLDCDGTGTWFELGRVLIKFFMSYLYLDFDL